jgi:hypothetical protein
MNIKQLEKEILKALKINSKIDWSMGDPNKEFKDLKQFVQKLFKEHNNN